VAVQEVVEEQVPANLVAVVVAHTHQL